MDNSGPLERKRKQMIKLDEVWVHLGHRGIQMGERLFFSAHVRATETHYTRMLSVFVMLMTRGGW